ncbi:MAG: hypothetical protein ABSC56_04595 [Solirubrobacteraceae bacterium]|jgi:hypothetical protein
MTGAEAFAEGLRSLGFTPELRNETLVVFDYEVEVGPLTGETCTIGLQVAADWPLTPPGGPIIAPRILPIHPGQDVGHPYGGVHENPELGVPAHYLSRPFPGWAATDRSVCAYLGHIRHLFDTLPDELQRRTDN